MQHACMHMCVYVCMYVCVYVCMYVCMHAYVCVCVYVCMYVCTCARTYVCMCVCMPMYAYIYICIWTHPPTAHEITLVSRRRHWQSFLLPQRQKRAQSDRPLWPTSVCSVAKLENKERGKQKKRSYTRHRQQAGEARRCKAMRYILQWARSLKQRPEREWATGQLQTQEGLRAEAKIIDHSRKTAATGRCRKPKPSKKALNKFNSLQGTQTNYLLPLSPRKLARSPKESEGSQTPSQASHQGGGPSREFPKRQGRAAAVGGMQASKATLERMLVQLTWAGTPSQAIVWEKTFFMHSSPHVYIKNSPEAIQKR